MTARYTRGGVLTRGRPFAGIGACKEALCSPCSWMRSRRLASSPSPSSSRCASRSSGRSASRPCSNGPGRQPSFRPRSSTETKTDPAGSVFLSSDLLDLEEVQLDRRLAAEHVDEHLDLAAGLVDLGHLALESLEGAVGDRDGGA